MELSRNNEHMLFSPRHDMETICQSLFKQTPIDYFDYERYYPTGEGLFLTNYPWLLNSVLSKEYYPKLSELKNLLSTNSSINYLSERMPLSQSIAMNESYKYTNMIKISSELNIYNRVYLISQEKDYIRACGFGAKMDSLDIFSFFINSIPLLEQFIDHFECEASHLISQQNRTKRIILPDYLSESDFSERQQPEHGKPPKSMNHPLIINNKRIHLTAREKQCLSFHIQGHSSKEVATQLGISHRTVEQHIYNAKKSIGPASKEHLRKVLSFQNSLITFQ